MQTRIEGRPAFCHIHVELEPGETIIAESGAMASMDTGLNVRAVFNGGLFVGLLRKVFGRESLFVTRFTNVSSSCKRVTLTQVTPGEIAARELAGEAICLQPGAYVCSTPELKLGLRWAGFRSWFAREGLFKLQVSGTGTLWYGAYGALVEKTLQGEYIVDMSHLVAYDPHIRLRVQLPGGFFSSFLGGEGFVTRVEGHGKIVLQTRSLHGLSGWLK